MANTFTSLHVHLVFSTKHREPWIQHDSEERIWKYLGGIARENGLKPIRTGGMPDHIHMLCGLPATMAVSEAAKAIKGSSSAWIKKNFRGMRGFSWQDGYGAFTVSKSNLEEVVCYIESQREHHRVKSFQEEYRAFLERHEIDYDERYLWD